MRVRRISKHIHQMTWAPECECDGNDKININEYAYYGNDKISTLWICMMRDLFSIVMLVYKHDWHDVVV